MNYNFDKKVIMATVDEETFSKALSSNGDLIFMLTSDVLTVGEKISLAHKAGKKVFVHISDRRQAPLRRGYLYNPEQ